MRKFILSLAGILGHFVIGARALWAERTEESRLELLVARVAFVAIIIFGFLQLIT